MAYTSPFSVNEALFQYSGLSPTLDLPCYLERLVSALPPGHRITANRLIHDHTLLPFYSPFLPAERVERIRKEMQHGNGGIVHKLAGINNSSIRVTDWFRFCPVCIEEDRARFGTTYWHRIHQLPSIEVCADHAVFLENSTAPARNRFDNYSYIPAEHAIVDSQARSLNLSNTVHSIELSIARDAKWLLLRGNVPSDLIGMRTRYLKLLSERGLAVMTGIVWIRKLLPAIKGHFTSELLSILQCDFDADKNSSWPAELIKDITKGKTHHPLRHLLMIQFLGHRVESFFKLPITDQPFGKGPWPCLNPTCSHHGMCTINKIQVVYKTVCGKGILPSAIFKCAQCSFTYYRIGPDHQLADSNRITKVLEYGPTWDAALRKYWKDQNLGLREVAKSLGVADRNLIKREAERLGLLFPRQGPGYKVAEKNKKQRPRYPNDKKPSKEAVSQYRREWQLARKDNPKLSRSALIKRFPRLSYRLKRYDSRWFAAHLPSRRKTGGKTHRVDWGARDIELARAIKPAVKLLKETPDKPRKITKSLIGKNIDSRSLLDKYLHKLPRTRKVLEEVVETRMQFAQRRIQWATDSFHEEKVRPSRSALLHRAALDFNIWEEPLVKAATEAALNSFMEK